MAKVDYTYKPGTRGKYRYGAVSAKTREMLDRATDLANQSLVSGKKISRVDIYSGGQPAGTPVYKNGVRQKARAPVLGAFGGGTGSVRHDFGGAADVHIYDENGNRVSWTSEAHKGILTAFARSAAQVGATGIGFGPGYMGNATIHVGFGEQATWGGMPQNMQQAVKFGMANRLPDAISWNPQDEAIAQINRLGYTTVEDFQRAMGLGVDGAVGPQTMTAAYMADTNASGEKVTSLAAAMQPTGDNLPSFAEAQASRQAALGASATTPNAPGVSLEARDAAYAARQAALQGSAARYKGMTEALARSALNPGLTGPAASTGRAHISSPIASVGRANISSPIASTGRANISTPAASVGRATQSTASLSRGDFNSRFGGPPPSSTGRAHISTPSASTGRAHTSTPSASSGRAHISTPSASTGRATQSSSSLSRSDFDSRFSGGSSQSTGRAHISTPPASTGRAHVSSPLASTGRAHISSPVASTGRAHISTPARPAAPSGYNPSTAIASTGRAHISTPQVAAPTTQYRAPAAAASATPALTGPLAGAAARYAGVMAKVPAATIPKPAPVVAPVAAPTPVVAPTMALPPPVAPYAVLPPLPPARVVSKPTVFNAYASNPWSGAISSMSAGLNNVSVSRNRAPSGNYSNMVSGTNSRGQNVSSYTDSRGVQHNTTTIGGREYYSRGSSGSGGGGGGSSGGGSSSNSSRGGSSGGSSSRGSGGGSAGNGSGQSPSGTRGGRGKKPGQDR